MSQVDGEKRMVSTLEGKKGVCLYETMRSAYKCGCPECVYMLSALQTCALLYADKAGIGHQITRFFRKHPFGNLTLILT